MATGRFAPSPTGALHLGNLRTALIAWMWARHDGDRFLVRMEDLDRVTSSREHETAQLRDLAAIGLDWDGDVVRQSERFDRYEAAIATLDATGRVYRCYCTRREIAEAAAAPHADTGGRYPGTCRDLTSAQRAEREGDGRPPALRLRADDIEVSFVDELAGAVTGRPDDVVLRRNDGVPAYNLAVVVDDHDQGVGLVVRGDDLLHATPGQLHLGALLGMPSPRHAHVPLVVDEHGERLAKRHGAVTLADRVALGDEVADVVAYLLASCGSPETSSAAAAATAFDPRRIPREPVVADGHLLTRSLRSDR
ncbi:MAG: tRNA glutamyl-Q(34) synthetase GluQRS [Acidimicrobiales bacterium]